MPPKGRARGRSCGAQVVRESWHGWETHIFLGLLRTRTPKTWRTDLWLDPEALEQLRITCGQAKNESAWDDVVNLLTIQLDQPYMPRAVPATSASRWTRAFHVDQNHFLRALSLKTRTGTNPVKSGSCYTLTSTRWNMPRWL